MNFTLIVIYIEILTIILVHVVALSFTYALKLAMPSLRWIPHSINVDMSRFNAILYIISVELRFFAYSMSYPIIIN